MHNKNKKPKNISSNSLYKILYSCGCEVADFYIYWDFNLYVGCCNFAYGNAHYMNDACINRIFLFLRSISLKANFCEDPMSTPYPIFPKN